MIENFPDVPEVPFPIKLGGGLDTETPVLSQLPGGVMGSENYEPKLNGGYVRIGGICRYDGRPRPSEAVIRVLGAQSSFGAMALGDTVTGAPSGATGKVVYASSTQIALTDVVGAFATGDTLTIGGAYKGVARVEPSVMAQDYNLMQAGAEDFKRASIGPVPGLAGTPVRGAAILYGVLYAWRDQDALTQKVFKATAAGWVEVPLLQRIAFTGGTTEYAEGSTLSKGGVTATVRRVVQQGGDPDNWSAGSPASGWLIISGASGSFTAGAAAGGGLCTLSGPQEQITLKAGGRWDLKPYNFGGGLTMRLYGADGVNDLIEFDGEILVPIPVAMPLKPSAVEVHKQHVWAAFGTSLQRSAIQNPYLWTVITGSAEIGMGDIVTGLKSVAGSETEAAMLVTSLNRSAAVYGDSSSFKISTLSTEVGAAPFTIQEMGKVVALDAAGMRDFTPTQAFGNFKSQTITDHIIRQATNLQARASVVSKATGRYRLFLGDGRMLSGVPGKRWTWQWCRLPWTVNVACEGEINGLSCVFIGCDDGYVREMDIGRSFDGESISYWLKLPFSMLGEPGRNKALARASLEMSTSSAGLIKYYIETDYGDSERIGTSAGTADTPPPPAPWDVGNWDTGVWDGKSGQTIRIRAKTTAENVSFTFFGDSRTELPHELHSLVIYKRKRRTIK